MTMAKNEANNSKLTTEATAMEAKEAKDLTKAAKDKKDKKKSDYDKLKEAEKQTIRDALISKATAIIDQNIKDAANGERYQYSIQKSDALLVDMDDTAITQLMAIYNTPGQGGMRFVCTDTNGSLYIDWT
jgi:hypothetical protein